jgi:hypothetical protein
VSSQAQIPSTSRDKAQVCIEEPPRGLRSAIYSALGLLLQISIEWLVRLTGRKIRRSDAPWLDCVLGKPGVIGTGIYPRIAKEENLVLSQPPDAGLIENFRSLSGPSFDPDQVDPRIRQFYEHAALYRLEVWSEVYLAGKFVLWLLVEFISRRMDQLNFPISPLEVSKGMTSEIVQLREPGTGRLVHTGWLRRFKSTGKVIYAGLYSVTKVPGETDPCVKVTFPCYGSSSVYLRPSANADHSFQLDSSGSGFGRSGFYRVVESGPDHWRVRNFRSLHELFHVYVDEENVLRVDHKISFVGLTILRLHYRMSLAPSTDALATETSRSVSDEQLV